MRFMRMLAKVNRRVTNPVFGVIAGRVPGYALVRHVGRRSGRRYRTPIGITLRDNDFSVAVNYGAQSDWVRNVLATGSFEIEHRGAVLALDEPHLVQESGGDVLRATVRSRTSP